MSRWIIRLYSKVSSSWEYIGILLYLFVGTFFLGYQLAGANYLTLFTSIFTNKIFQTIFLYPSFIFLFILTYSKINHQSDLIIRLNTRKKYAQYMIATVTVFSAFLFLQVLLILLINCNLIPHTNFSTSNSFGYDCSDFIVSFVQIVKIFCTVLTLAYLSLLLQFVSKVQVTTVILMIAIILLFFLERMYPTGIMVLDTLNPGFHSSGLFLETSIWKLTITGMIYFVIVFIILYIGIIKSARKGKIGI